ncbi:hypothetical protein PUNSTDRAFT_69535 [Punctularia strigosozonata HHB-11173 SS5]|uniref:uncharacterized protein n=1 Tax=Punctularia strigosozonata (strain HHB-11173) TaxID=741275 RepID=UPI0004418563|nr:uncharacterized protein PUNSTDRAFT_69535 [Punctularia strigosozonata HHB-11173 SS5]EIN07581.1 hypothetical protein PUNSTDRAFT_69535 [Punctularia strigosozonata HHB-11173 SS5]
MSDSDPGLSQPLGAYGPRTADRSPEIEVIPIGAEDLPSAPVDKTRPVADGLPSANQSSNRPCQCSTPATGRNLVVCIDGTANQFGKKNSHVVELYSRLIKDENQLTYYNSGIGTYVKESKWYPSYWKQGFTNKVDLAIAWNFKKIVLSAYQWLSENYKPGDKIYLFGFSRGAYQIRVIAGMIMTVGLLHKGNNEQIEFPKHVEEALELSERFKKALSQRNVNVHFVGAWDTVSSIGFARGPGLPETTTGMTHVCIFRHALALDELRVKFLPEYANGGHGPRTEPESNRQDTPSTSAGLDRSAEKGRNDENTKLDRFGPALQWMTYEALLSGVRMEPFIGKWQNFSPHHSMNWFWRLLEGMPLRRLSYDPTKDNEHTRRW